MATEVASIYAKIGADLSGFHSGMSMFNSSIHSAGGMFRSFTTGIVQGVGQAFGMASIRAIRGFGDAIGSIINSAADMEQAVADIAATMGLTADETSKVSKLVSDLGIDPKLKVTSLEAASAIEMLGKNGLALDEILQGAARSTVLLSNSTGGDLTTSADIATSAMSQFKIGAEDMSGAVNQIVGVTRNSKFDIDDYRLAISQAGGVAASVGVEFGDFNAAIASISPLFASGSDAGTSFKTFLQRLVPQSNEAADEMRKIGLYTGLTGKEFEAVQGKLDKVRVKIEELNPSAKNYHERLGDLSRQMSELKLQLNAGESAFFDANGQMKSMSEVAQSLQNAFSGLSEEQKISAATTIFGTDAMRAAFALADGGASSIDKLKLSIGNTSAEESAAIRMNTLKGAWEVFTGIVESLAIQLGTAFLPALRDVVAGLQELATRIGPHVVAWGQELGEKFKMVTGAAVGLINIGLDKGFANLFAPMEDGGRHLDKLFEAFGMTKDQAKKAAQQFLDTVTTIKNMAIAIGTTIAEIAKITTSVAGWIDKTVGLENAIKVVGAIMAGSFVVSIASTIGTIVSAVGSVASFVGGLTGLGTVATTIGGAVVAAISAIGGPITLLIAAIGALAIAWHNNWWDIQGKTRAAWDAIKQFIGDGVQAIKNFFSGGWYEIGQNMVRGIVDGIRAGWQWVTDAAKGVAEAAVNTAETALGISSPSKVFAEMGRNVAAGLGQGINAGTGMVTNSIQDVTSALIEAWNSQADEWRMRALEHLRPIINDLRQQFRIFEDASMVQRSSSSALNIDQLVNVINQMSHDVRVAFVESLPQSVKDAIRTTYRIFEDATIGVRDAARETVTSIAQLVQQINAMAHDVRVNFVNSLGDDIRQAILRDYRIFEDASIGMRQTNNASTDIAALVNSINAMSHDARLAYVNNLAPETRQSILRDYRIYEDASIAPRRIEVTIRGESNIPSDKASLRNLARALQQEFVMSGARVTVP